jgi:Cof subfamily protein (haloacid dehalogenase superfamily)
MGYKMVCIDMDGTLLTKRKKVSEESREIIKKVYDKGVEIVVTTGRIYNNAEYYSNFLGVKSPVIAANGAIVKNKIDSEIIYENPISMDECMKLIDLLYEMKFLFHFYTTDGIFCNNAFTEISTKLYMTKQVGYESLKINYHVIRSKEKWINFFKENKNKITKCIVFSAFPEKINKCKENLKKIEGIVYFGAGKRSIEINNRGVSKGNAVKALAQKYGIKREEIICIGDNENDLSMIEYAGLGVAMGNAIDSVKEIADYVTSSNDDNGVAKALKKFFDI